MRDELDTARAKLDDESHEPHGMHKINIAHALYVVVKKLRDLTFWAHVPDPEPLPAGWLDAVKDGLQPAITRRNFLADNRVTGYASVTRQKIFSAGFP
ncbi:MAG: hypothetical protein EXS16_00005 [Gemmataceae bacterium]|nr:hypothetical protein [Gemmataceae bacterium]